MAARKVNKDFFKEWSLEMAYVLGFFFADGTLTLSKRGGRYISFHSADKSLLLSVRNALDSTHSVAQRSARSGRVYRLQIGSKEMFDDLLLLGLTLQKSKRMILPPIPAKFFGDFVRGYFDGDGNVWIGKINKERKKPTQVMQLCFTSGCGVFLHGMRARLQEGGIRGGSIFMVKNKHCYRLGFSTVDALKVHEIMYNTPSKLCLKRKKRVFEQFVKMRS